MDTIFALATARGKSGVAVIRISGGDAHRAATALAGDLPPPGQLGLRRLTGATGETLDTGLVLTFAEGKSFTGEPVVELQIHGSIATTDSVLGELGAMRNLRMAQPGEFTRRAFLNGRMDLTQVEGLAALIDAETEAQRVLAQRTFGGDLGRKVALWRASLVQAAALLEASIDFVDEDVPVNVVPDVVARIDSVSEMLRNELTGVPMAERMRDGFQVAIVGKPNVGKSTLLNRLAGRDVAITSQIAGTTRDTLEVRMDLGGLPVTMIDTAGIRETEDEIESLGVARAVDRARGADVRIFLKTSHDEKLVEQPRPEDLVLVAKDDAGHLGDESISSASDHGIDSMLRKLQEVLENKASIIGTASTERQAVAMNRALEALQEARRDVQSGEVSFDTAAEHLRAATRDLSALVGRVDVEDLLDHIFASFCIGK